MPSGTIYGSFSAKSTSIARPYINWSYTQNTTNNQSTITATLVFVRYDGYRVWNNDASNFTITIDGFNDTEGHAYDIGPNGKTDTIFSSSRTVTHDDDGERKVTIKASGNTNNSALGTISLSQTITLNTIARASDFTNFTLSNPTLNTSTATTINYTLGRKSSSFSHAMTLKFGSSTIASWSTSGTGNLTRTLSSSEVNSIINKMPTTTGGTLSLTMQTKSGSTNIGSSKTINEGISLNSAIKPSASGLSVAIAGSGRDKTIGQYVQNITKITASFTRSAGYGASISSSTINVKRQSDGGNSQTISSHSGTTANAVSLSGVYVITGTVKDSRGRTDTVTHTITVQAYSVPKISRFTAVRKSPTTTIEYGVGVTWTTLGTSNPATLTVVGKDNSNVSTTHYTLSGSTAGSVSTTRTATSQSDASSYIFTLTVTDSFGKKATATVNVGTSFVELTISKGYGVGVGKVHERGALDVAGEAYFKDNVHTRGIYGNHNGTSMLQDHGNGNVTLSAQVGDLYLGYQNTNKIRLITSLWTSDVSKEIISTSGVMHPTDIYLQDSNSVRVVDNIVTIYGNRANGGNSFRVRSHHNSSSYRNDLIISDSGMASFEGIVYAPAGFRSGSILNPNSNIMYIGANQETRVVSAGDLGTYQAIRASSFPTGSSILYKENVEQLPDGALDIVLGNRVFKYHLTSNLNNGIYDKPKVGFIAEMVDSLLRDEDGVDTYSIVSILWKAVQEQHVTIEQLINGNHDLYDIIAVLSTQKDEQDGIIRTLEERLETLTTRVNALEEVA
ncbi:DUF859 family phage minor structural protein [Sutcliffiella horikoshii]|uniref:DUF859 family phage minor structural protein n=1 Tax=Sutcliffiella horikoshii TaxID=79883 RepID=UPI003CF94C79